MADIDVERKSSMAWLWWLLGLLLLALLAWWLLSGDDEEEVAAVDPVVAPAVVPTATPEPVAQGPLCVAQVLPNPTTFVGQRLGTCPMQVVEVVSDRGFWAEENGQRVFVIINESPVGGNVPGTGDVQGQAAERPDVNVGQLVNVTEATVMDNVQNVVGEMDEQTRTIAQQQPWFLVADGTNISGTAQGNPAPATTTP